MKNREKKIDSAHGGAGWQGRSTSLSEEIGMFWANCGCDSECAQLRKVLLHRPGNEIAQVSDANAVHWNELIDLSKAQDQHDALADFYRQHGVEVIYLEPSQAMPNHYFIRDLFTMTPQGAILSRMAAQVRAGEEIAVHQCLARHDIPIIKMINGNGVFEGPDIVFAEKDIAFVATSIRSNLQGAAQVAQVLQEQGIQVIDIQTTYGCGHLDGVMNIIDSRKAILYPTRVSYDVYKQLSHLGYEIIDLPDLSEAEHNMAINMVALAPGIVLMPSGSPKTVKCLQQHGVEVFQVDVSELMHGGGAVHCMTGVLWRK